MKVLVIGNGSREHAIIWKLLKDDSNLDIYCAPGNGGTAKIAKNINIEVNEIEKLKEFALENKIDFTIVGPEQPLVMGIVDLFEANNLDIFGPNKYAAALEGSKAFSKDFMKKYDIPTADYHVFQSKEEAVKIKGVLKFPCVVKADGLAQGKGVLIVNSIEEYIEALDEIFNQNKFKGAGNKVVVEEFLDGIELSLMCAVDENSIIPLESAKDYKKVFDGDKGLNTGGMGSYSPHQLMQGEMKKLIEEKVTTPILQGLKQEGIKFKGILFIGFMIVGQIPYVLEFNARFGDPETQSVLPRLESNLLDIMKAVNQNKLSEIEIKWSEKSCVSVVLASGGYPESYEKNKYISIEKTAENQMVFQGGTVLADEKLYTSGGRVLTVSSLGNTIEEARSLVYNGLEFVKFENQYYRNDIAKIK